MMKACKNKGGGQFLIAVTSSMTHWTGRFLSPSPLASTLRTKFFY